MQFNLTIQEIYEKKVTVEAEGWHEALMKTIKESDRGKYIIEDNELKESNVSVDGWPYEIVDKWTIEDVEKYIEGNVHWREMNLSENEMRQALYLMGHNKESKGFNLEKLDKALSDVVSKNK